MDRKSTVSFQRTKLVAAMATVAGMTFAAQANAFTVYEDESNLFTVGGRIAPQVDFVEGESAESVYGGTRINLEYEHYLDNGWTLFGRWEEGFDAFFTTSDKLDHFNRQKHFGMDFAEYGRVSVGRQNSIIYDMVDVWTDMPMILTNYSEISFIGGEFNGATIRPNDSIKYTVDVSDFSLGAMVGWSTGNVENEGTGYSGIERNHFAQLGGQYHVYDDLSFALAGHFGDSDYGRGTYEENVKSYAWNAGVLFSPENFWFAANFAQSYDAAGPAIDGDHDRYPNYNHFSAFGGYTFEGAFGEYGDLQAYYQFSSQREKGESSERTQRHVVGLGAFLFDDTIMVGLDHGRIDDKDYSGNDTGPSHETSLLLRYNF